MDLWKDSSLLGCPLICEVSENDSQSITPIENKSHPCTSLEQQSLAPLLMDCAAQSV